jgi:3-phenylpropionate/trans-cinnamate dioxygenase ferredoxin reductase subunit
LNGHYVILRAFHFLSFRYRIEAVKDQWEKFMENIVIIGAGQAGQSLGVKLRSEGYGGALTIIGEEPAPPYQRPPLSKAYLLGEMPRERLFLRPEAFYAEHDIALRLGTPVEAIDPGAQLVRLKGGETLPYDALALTTGATPNRLPAALGGNLAGVYTVRSLADVDAMIPEFASGRRLLIVGGGYIGLEAAAVARKMDLEVTLIEAAPRILQRVASPQTADFFRKLHSDHGVKIIEGTAITRLGGETQCAGAFLEDGREIQADFCILGIGVRPNTGLAEAAGLTIDNGIATDAQARTSDPNIWAAGDCASFPLGGARMRLESVGNAIDQAELVALNMLGAGKDYTPKPWFWSDQYDVKLQIAGLSNGYDQVITRKSDPGISFWYYADNKLIAVDAANDPRAYMVGKRLIEAGRSPDPIAVANPATDLNSLMSA